MAKNETKRLAPDILQADKDSLTALQAIANYTPSNSAFAVATVQTGLTAMGAAQSAETLAQQAADTARDNATAKEWAFHNSILGAKEQVIAQFGKDSNEVQSLGLKKKSEYKTPIRKPTTGKSSQANRAGADEFSVRMRRLKHITSIAQINHAVGARQSSYDHC